MEKTKIYLIGFMGVGKTSIGKKLAKKIGYTFIDTDRRIEQKENLSVSEIFEQKGETYFRLHEQEILNELQTQENCVISVGGGLPCFFDNMKKMLHNGIVFYLQSTPENLQKRLALSKQKRPLLENLTENETLNYITNKLIEREKFYLKAHHIINTDKGSTEEIIKSITNEDEIKNLS